MICTNGDSRFLRYVDTRPNGDALRKCILTGPYTPKMVTTPAVPATEDSREIPAKTSVETVLNMTSVHNSSGLASPRQMTSDHNSSELGIHDHSNELSRSKLVPKVVPPADKTRLHHD
ncbi:hypothetical protein Tco_0729896 [Tanacetum coccineum]|uniref:Uncharacterized protein n=1 Tax=Tanacetum coccineum TaxID=301880 RepID=A0ABQ4YR50_9ASTR